MAEEPVQTVEQQTSPGWQWIQDFAGDMASSTAMRYAGAGVKRIPHAQWLGNVLEGWGRFGQLYAAPNATVRSINRATGWDQDTPTTWGGHAKKWVRSAGTEAALGMGMQGAGLLLSAIPHPATMWGGRLLAGAGKAVTGYSWANASLGTATDLLGNHIQNRLAEREAQAQRMQEMRDRYSRAQQRSNLMGAGIAGLAGFGGASLLLGAIPGFRRKKSLRYLASMLAAAGAGYAGWKYMNNQQNKYRVV